ncbi:MAG: fluoride efflux transporter CrcB [Bacteroidales bacterium]|nr:fluoride efflux transporter CrcB [Bacteroidales bacterium]
MLQNILVVGLGGFFGAIARYSFSFAIPKQELSSFPFSTLLVNLIGSLLIGLIFGFIAKQQMFNEKLFLFLTIGFCGSFTTFSTFSLENFQLLTQGKWLLVLLYTLVSVVCGLFLIYLGFLVFKNPKL